MSASKKSKQPDLAAEYDFSGGRRGKYAARYREGTNLVAIDPDLLELFPDAEAVNKALRSIVRERSAPRD